MEGSIRHYEREVEEARAKLADDLATLRSPSTLGSLKDSLKDTALDAKDAVMEQAKDALQTRWSGFVEDLKAKAAANPAAALTIGAGLAWHFVRHPPIATALIGAGLFSLWRTEGAHLNGGDEAYARRGAERLKEQTVEFGAAARDVASDVGTVVADKAAEIAASAQESVREWSQKAAEGAAQAGSSVSTRAEVATDSARRLVHDIRDLASDGAGKISGEAARVAGDVASQVATGEARDKLLLGVAGLAVAAALGIAAKKRIAEATE